MALTPDDTTTYSSDASPLWHALSAEGALARLGVGDAGLNGFVQESKAEDALAAIRQMLSPMALALCDDCPRLRPSFR